MFFSMTTASVVTYVILVGLIYLLLKNVFHMNIVAIIGIILVIIVIYMYSFNNTNTLQDLQNGETMTTIDASSLETNGTGAPPTNFTYSIWFFINDFTYQYGVNKPIFVRNTSASVDASHNSINDISGVGPCPTVYLGATENTISTAITYMSDTSNNLYICDVPNVPIQKWVNFVIVVYGRTLDSYIDGKLVRTCLLPNIAEVATDSPIVVTPQGGFDGWTAKFQYFASALNPQEVYNIYTAGYGNSLFSNTYQIQLSLIENGNTQASTTF